MNDSELIIEFRQIKIQRVVDWVAQVLFESTKKLNPSPNSHAWHRETCYLPYDHHSDHTGLDTIILGFFTSISYKYYPPLNNFLYDA